MRKTPLAHAPTQYHRPCCTPRIVTRPSRAEAGIEAVAWIVLIALACLFALMVAAGCAVRPHAPSPLRQQAAQTVAQVKARNAVDVAQATAHGKLQAAQDASPASHPIAATNQTVKRVRAPYEVVSVVAGVIAAIFVGLLFTPLSWLSKIGLPVSLATAALSFLTAIALPYVPWLLAAAGLIALGVLIYECIRHRSIKAGLQAAAGDVESELYGLTGFAAPAASSLSSVAAAATNELATLTADAEHVLGLAGTKAAPIVTTSPPPPPPAPVPVPA